MLDKICFKCNIEKPIESFYKHKAMADGHLNKCKSCTILDSSKRATRPDMVDKIREQKRALARNETQRATRKKYMQGVGREIGNLAKKSYINKNPIKRKAHNLVQTALRNKTLIKPNSCESCKEEKPRISGHHCDYSKPLDVMWLCPSCHSEWHRNNESINGE